MNRIPNAVVALLPYLLVFIGLAVMFVPDGGVGRGSGVLVLIAGLSIFKLQIDMRAPRPISIKGQHQDHEPLR